MKKWRDKLIGRNRKHLEMLVFLLEEKVQEKHWIGKQRFLYVKQIIDDVNYKRYLTKRNGEIHQTGLKIDNSFIYRNYEDIDTVYVILKARTLVNDKMIKNRFFIKKFWWMSTFNKSIRKSSK